MEQEKRKKSQKQMICVRNIERRGKKGWLCAYVMQMMWVFVHDEHRIVRLPAVETASDEDSRLLVDSASDLSRKTRQLQVPLFLPAYYLVEPGISDLQT